METRVTRDQYRTLFLNSHKRRKTPLIEHWGQSGRLPDLKEIRLLRHRLRISQRRLAKDIGISQSMVTKIENGKINPSYKLVERIFRYLDSLHTISMGSAGSVASRPVIAVQKTDTVASVVAIMQSKGFKQVPVLEGVHNIGSISERGISRRVLEAKKRDQLLRRPVGSVMEEALPVVPEEVPLDGIVSLLQQTQAILTSKGGKVSGIITNADLLKLISKGA